MERNSQASLGGLSPGAGGVITSCHSERSEESLKVKCSPIDKVKGFFTSFRMTVTYTRMKLFIDTANLDEIKTAASWGILDGVTTNPTLIAKEGRDFKKTILEICKMVDGPISAETVSLDAEGMVKEGKEFVTWHKNVHVKVPCTAEGIKAVVAFKKLKIKTNVTLVFSTNQVLLAAKAGATLISPFVGRLVDAGENGMNMIAESVQIIENYGFESQILVASVRDPRMVTDAATLGAHIATVPFKVLEMLFKHPLTDVGIKKFLEDWAKVSKK